MLEKIKQVLNRTIFRRLRDIETSQLIILKRSDDSLRRMESIMGNFEDRTIAIGDMLDRMEEKMSKFEERVTDIEHIELELYDMVSPRPSVDLDMNADLNRVV